MKRFFRKIKQLLRKKQFAVLKIAGRIRPILRNAKTGAITYTGAWEHNLIPTVGLRAIARRIGKVSLLVNEGAATYGAIGKGNTTPVASDTIMENEVARKLIAISSEASRIVSIETFYDETEGNDTITKFALFGEDASAATDSGTMMEYADFGTSFTKTNVETLTVEIQITVSDA